MPLRWTDLTKRLFRRAVTKRSPAPRRTRLDLTFLEERTLLNNTFEVDGGYGPLAETYMSTRTFTFRRSGDLSGALSVPITLSGTAVEGTQYTVSAHQIDFAPGQSQGSVDFAVTNDTVAEPDTTFTLNFPASVDGFTVLSQTVGPFPVWDDDRPPIVTVTSSGDTSEGGSPATFTLTRSTDLQGPAASTALLTTTTALFALGGAATEGGVDYTASATTSVAFGMFQTTATVTITPVNDPTAEYSESVVLALQSGTNYSVGTPDSATVIIRDNEQPVVMVEKIYDALEGGDSGWYAFSRRGDASQALTVNFTVSGTATSGIDYTSIGTSVTFPAGEAVAYKEVAALSDSTFDPGELVTVTITSGAGYSIDTANTATVTIEDATPVITVEKLTDAYEDGAVPGTFRFARTGDLSQSLVVTFLVGGTATSGTDFTAIGTSVTFLAGAAEVDLAVTPVNDSAADPGETVTVTVQTSANYLVGTYSSASLMIVDDETPLVTVWAIADAAEGTPGSVGMFRFNRGGDTSSSLVVSYSVTGVATAGVDYPALSGSVTFPVGASTVDVSVTPTNDTTAEGTETVVAAVISGSTYGADPFATAEMNIADNDGPAGEIGGVLWDDTDGDGIRESGEPLLSGQAVNLLDANAALVLQTVSDANGAYKFVGLIAGTYFVQAYAPLLNDYTDQNQGSDEAADSDLDPVSGLSGSIALTTLAMTNLLVGGGFTTIAPPPTPTGTTIKITTRGGDTGPNNNLKIAKWSDAFEADPADAAGLLPPALRKPRLRGPDANQWDFIDRDPDRFNIWVYDLTKWNLTDFLGNLAFPTINVTLETTNPGNAEYNDNATTISLVRMTDPGFQGWYWSDSLMLVSNKVDDEFFNANVGKDNQGPGNDINVKNGHAFPVSDRTHLIALGGTVKAVYVDANSNQRTAESTVQVEKVVKLHVTILRNKALADGGEEVVPVEWVNDDIKYMREIYAQAGIRVLVVGDNGATIGAVDNTQIKNPPVGVTIPGNGNWLEYEPEVNGVKMGLSPEEDKLLGDATLRTPTQFAGTPAKKDDIEIYYINKFAKRTAPADADGLRAYAYTAGGSLDAKYTNSVIVTDFHKFNTLAHEVMHHLTANGWHYTVFPQWSGILHPLDRVNTLVGGFDRMLGPLIGSGPFGVGTSIIDSRRITPQQASEMTSAKPTLLFPPNTQ